MIKSAALIDKSGLEIAIIGLAGRFPGAEDVEKFWHNLQNGVESISVYTDEALLNLGIDKALLSDTQYIKSGAPLENIELFDASFFGFNPREAEIIDPQHRLFLECAWEAIENAGYDSENYQGSIGVYAGTSMNSYMLNLYANQVIRNSVDNYQLLLASDKDFLTTRVSYKLNLEGPSINVQTSCSTSLVAVHTACQSLLSGECDIALAGGVSISKKVGYSYKEGGIYSPDGHCRAFDAKAQGTVGGSGLGIVVLKRLEDALADGDCIHAVLKGSAINNDGAFKVSYTAPRIDSQAKVIRAAQVMAEVDAETITYVEAHGTGTSLGDPIEIAALTQAFRASTQKKGFCAIGSVKTNIGHLDATSGVASLIKTVLALKYKQIPPSLHFEQPNPQIDFANSPFYVNTTLSEWKTNDIPRRAGVSSFGIGGTNAHVILEEAPSVQTSGSSRPWQLLVLSAKSSSALDTATANLAAHLKQHPDLNLADVAYTLQVGRRAFDYRRILVCQNLDDARMLVESADKERVLTQFQEPCNRPIVFMFPGQGTQYANMGKELYQIEATFREQVDRCCELLKPHLGLDLHHVLYPSEEQAQVALEQLEQTYIAQPALFVIEYALAQLWMMWGICPEAMIGHGIGEYVAACLAGVFSLEDALTLVAASGGHRESFTKEVEIKLNPPQIPFVSNVTGTWITAAEATAPAYWARNLQQTVRFAAGIAELIKPNRILLEVGPGQTLSTFAKQHPDLTTQQVVSSLPHPQEQSDLAFLLNTLGRLWLAGVKIDWFGFYATEHRHRIPLPTYPFERQRYWVEPQPEAALVTTSQELLHKRPNIADWFYIPSWERDLPVEPFENGKLAEQKSCWLVFVDQSGVGSQIVKRLEKEGQNTIAVTVGEQFHRISDRAFAINPQKRDDYDALFQTLRVQGLSPNVIAHLWGINIEGAGEAGGVLSGAGGISEFDKCQAKSFYSLLFLAQALGKQNITTPIQITVVTNNMHDVIGEEELNPEKATVLGLCKVIPQEYPNITCRSIDVVVPQLGRQQEKLIDQLIAEFISQGTDSVIAYRGHHRWLQTFKAVHLHEAIEEKVQFREGGIYLIAGDLLEGLGIVFAKYLAQTVQAKLILIGANFPEINEWAGWLATHDEQDAVSRQIRKMQALEELGVEFLIIKADVASTEQMQAAINQAYERFGQIHGVFYSTPMSNEKSASPIQQLALNQCEWNFKSKVHGLYVLEEVLQERELDFYLLQSSLSSVVGGLGLAAYSAANSFIDAFANKRNQTRSKPCFSVNWDACRAEGEGKKVGFGASVAELAMTPQEVWDASQRILSMGSASRVIVSKGDLKARIDEWIELALSQKTEDAKSSERDSSSQHSRPTLPNAYVAPRNEIEQIVINIWQELLGIEQIGVHDDFFELGGHSLLAVQTISRLRKTFQVELPMRSILFDAHTVAGLAAVIAENQPKQEDLQEMAELLEEVKSLSLDEIQEQIAVDGLS